METAVAVLLISTLTTVGLMALWAATSPRHWFVRTAVFLAALSPLLWVPAYEPFIALALEGATIAVGISAWRRFARRRAGTQRAGASPSPAGAEADPTNPQANRSAPRFRIATLLWATVLLSIAAAIGARMPDIGRRGWQSLIAIGIGGGLAVLLGWYAALRRRWWKVAGIFLAFGLALFVGAVLASVDWFGQMLYGGDWPPPRDGISISFFADNSAGMNWLPALPAVAMTTSALVWLSAVIVAAASLWRRRLVGATAVVAAAFISTPAAYVLWRMLTPALVPKVVLPEPNAFDEFVAAGESITNALVNSSNFDQDTAPRQQVAKAAGEVAAAVNRARRAFAMKCQVPVDYSSSESLLIGVQNVRSLARGFSVTARLAEMDGDLDVALTALLDAVRLGVEARRGGLLVDGMVGAAITGVGASGIHDLADRLSVAQCRWVIEALGDWEAECEPYDELERRDRIWTQHAFGWTGRLHQAVQDMSEFELSPIAQALLPYGYRGPFAMESIEFRLLVAQLAVRAYVLERGELPESWEEVVAAGLPELGLDPWHETGGRLQYRRTEQGFALYSVGQNGVDDGGARPDGYDDPQMMGVGDPATGDLTLEEVF